MPKSKKEETKQDSKLVKMKLGKKLADVHPKEVDNYKSYGWVKA